MAIRNYRIIILPFLLIHLLCAYPLNAQELLPSTDYIGLIQQKIDSKFVYPLEAQTNGWEGVTKVKFTLAKNGRIKEIDIAESSGYPLLDAMAILAVKDAGPYPFPHGYYPEEELELIVPVQFLADKPPTQTLENNPVISAIYKSTIKAPAPTSNAPEQAQEKQMTTSAPKEEAKPAADLPQEVEPFPYVTQPPPVFGNSEVASQSVGELTYFVDLALRNHEPTKVALEEIELAEIKVAESKRGLFPGLKLQAYNTTGEVNKVDYEEREIKTQLDQPIYYGGRLQNTYEQAKVNLEITKKNFDRLKLDVAHKAESAYYNLVATRISLKMKEQLYKEAKEMLEKVQKLYRVSMVTELEFTSSRSWVEQIGFQLDSTKQELFMAELTFKQVLNVKDTPLVTAEELSAKNLHLDLNQCIGVAFKHRPELKLSELLVKFNEFGQKIEADKSSAFTIDLTGSYGYYTGHFKTEPWRNSNNWFGGVKISKPWGGNTVNTSFNSEETQPRFGQTSPTVSSTLSGEFNLLDNLKRISDKKKSDIDLHRSLSDFDEAIKTVIFEVQDAFLNYQKALLQLNTAELDIKFRRNEVEVTKTRSMVGEVSISSALESLFSLSDAQTKYVQALANYQISLATLKKATGYGLSF